MSERRPPGGPRDGLRVVLDARMGQADRVGIGVYVRGLAAALARHHPADEFILLTSPRLPTIELPGIDIRDTPNLRIAPLAPTYQEYVARDRWEQWQLTAALQRLRADVYHSPNYTLPVLRRSPCAAVVTLYDASIFTMPAAYRLVHGVRVRYLIAAALRHADGAVFGSQHAESEFERLFPGTVPAVRRAIHMGVPADVADAPRPAAAQVTEVLTRYRIARPYLVAVGSVHPRKNYERLIAALAEPALAGLDLVIAGGVAWKAGTVGASIERLGLADRVKLTGFVPTADLRALVAGADAMVFPSLYEGFGIPPLEAFALGTPVCASNASSIPEVVGDAAELFDPRSVPEMAAALARVTGNQARRAELVARGTARLRAFSWARCAAEHMAVYRAAIRARAGFLDHAARQAA